MMTRSFWQRLRRFAVWVVFELALFAGALALSTSADTSTSFHKRNVGGCYCQCAQSKTSVGCTKLCEVAKNSSRSSAMSCAKPHLQTPTATPGAGPHYPRAPRAERASN